uniref:Integrase_H2C2 domain-containing protein n=1 Tax=Strongyloides papillosus TaxID=174720 RepID=A0A0N5C5I7_STREA
MSNVSNRTTDDLTDPATVDDLEKKTRLLLRTAFSGKVKDRVKHSDTFDLTAKTYNIKNLSETANSTKTWNYETILDELNGKTVKSIDPNIQLDEFNQKDDKIIYCTTHVGTTDSRIKIKSFDYCHNIFSTVDRTISCCQLCLTMRKLIYKLYVSWVIATNPRQINSFNFIMLVTQHNDESAIQVLESQLTIFLFSSFDCQHALDESLNENHVESDLKSLQLSINFKKSIIHTKRDYGSDTYSYDGYKRLFDKN